MTEFTDEEAADFFNPGANGANGDHTFTDEQDGVSYREYDALFDAPDFATLIKGARTKQARDYEIKVKSIVKTVAVGALRRGNLADAATFFEYGPAFSAAAGDLADVSDRTRSIIDMLTVPDNPYIAMGMIALPFVAQLFRNHQPEIQAVQQSRKQRRAFKKAHPEQFAQAEKKNVEVKLPFGRKLSFRVGFKFNPLRAFKFAFMTRTHEPQELVNRVFADEKLVAALKKQGITIVVQS